MDLVVLGCNKHTLVLEDLLRIKLLFIVRRRVVKQMT